VSTAARSVAASPATRRIALIVGLLALAAVIGFAIYDRAVYRPGADGGSSLSRAAGQAAQQAANGFRSVADLLAERSPGERVKGALANLKHRLLPALHQRALPKVRRPAAAPPISEAGSPPPAVLPPAAAPLYNMVTAPPVLTTPPGVVGPPGGFPIPPPPGGGGGIIIPPPVVIPPGPPGPPPPGPPGVPEPASWAMMLLGFAAIGHALRRRDRSLMAR
jgi:hypothetical protein